MQGAQSLVKYTHYKKVQRSKNLLLTLISKCLVGKKPKTQQKTHHFVFTKKFSIISTVNDYESWDVFLQM